MPPEPRVRLRLTVDGDSEEFWLAPIDADPLRRPLDPDQRKIVHGRRRSASVKLQKDEIDVGVSLFLHKFQRKLDPGTSMASHYSSLVDLRDGRRPDKVLNRDVLITLNQPINVTDPVSGRTYRFYQESFGGPWKPGEVRFDEFSSPGENREERFLSWLTVNYDPGRGLKYLGSLLIVAGVATMFYMKAYFFKPKRKHRD